MKKFKFLIIMISMMSILILLFGCKNKPTEPNSKKVAQPTFSPKAGTYDEPQSIVIKCSTKDAVIRYTEDGEDPTASSEIFYDDLLVPRTATIKARAFKEGLEDSDIATAEYTINVQKVAAPTISPAGGTFDVSQSVTLSCPTAGAKIFYTKNGTNPGMYSFVYHEPFTLTETATIKAFAYKAYWDNSDVVTAEFTIIPAVATPTFMPIGGLYGVAQDVSIACLTPDATIVYTTDGSDPTASSPVYSDAIHVSQDTTIKARAYKAGLNDGEIASATYVFSPGSPEMVYVSSGTFTMGRNKGQENDNAFPPHSVTLDSFFIGKYQVTQGEYEAIMGSNPASDYGVGNNYPVYNVSWYDAIKYCNLRSLNEGLMPVYSIRGFTNPLDWGIVPTESNVTWNAAICNWNANGYRLPTEAEWEYAARGATNNPNYLYSGSDAIANVAWYYNNSNSSAHPVGGKRANALGIYDMSGNVCESCWDWYDASYYSSSSSNNPSGPESGTVRVHRGGSWFFIDEWCQVAHRGINIPSYRSNQVGFRVCRTAN